jgi:hypothetical protein
MGTRVLSRGERCQRDGHRSKSWEVRREAARRHAARRHAALALPLFLDAQDPDRSATPRSNE